MEYIIKFQEDEFDISVPAEENEEDEQEPEYDDVE